MGSVTTSPVSRQAMKSRGASTQALAARRSASLSASQATLAATDRRRAAPRCGSQTCHPRRCAARPSASSPARRSDQRMAGPSGRPAASASTNGLTGSGAAHHLDRAEPLTGPGPGAPRRPRPTRTTRPPGPAPTTRGRGRRVSTAHAGQGHQPSGVPQHGLGDRGAQVEGEDHRPCTMAANSLGHGRRATAPGRWPGRWPVRPRPRPSRRGPRPAPARGRPGRGDRRGTAPARPHWPPPGPPPRPGPPRRERRAPAP